MQEMRFKSLNHHIKLLEFIMYKLEVHCILVCVCVLQSKLVQAYKMMPETSKEMLIVFITVYQMDPVTEYTGQVEN